MHDAVAFFAVRLICGMTFILCAMPRGSVPSPFFRIMLLVILGLAALFALTSPAALWWGVAMGTAAFAGSVFWLLERRTAGTFAIGAIFAISLVALLFGAKGSMLFADGKAKTWLAAASAFASATTLGGAFTGMLLGHRYLTAPGMPLAPLMQVNACLGMASILRFVVSTLCLAWAFGTITQSLFWIWLALRWLAGILGPMAVCVMVHRILRYRNTQAATGVLFVGVILTFIGELTADLLQRALGSPF
jgi:hypothetical protein